MFQLNDKVVYPGHGVATIKEIIEKSVSGNKLKFFKLNFLCKDMTILIPVNSHADDTGIRHLVSVEEAERATKELCKVPQKALDPSDFTPSSWNKRNKDYQLKIQGGKLIEMATVYRDLMYISKYKELSFGEKNLLQTIEELLVQEMVLVKKKDRADVIREIRGPFQNISFTGGMVQSTPSATAV